MDLHPSAGAEPSEGLMQWLVLVTTYVLLALFLIGVLDLFVGLVELLVSGRFAEPLAVIGLLETVLLLLIIVEVHRTLLAYVREEPVLQAVVGAAIIAVARSIIGFRVSDFGSTGESLGAAVALGALLLSLVVAYLAVRRVEEA